MAHEPRLTAALRELLYSQRIAALGTLADDGFPFVSMVPYAVDGASASVLIHVSALAAHTGYLQRTPAVSLLVVQSPVHGEPVHALPRVTLQGRAQFLARDSAQATRARSIYLQRFPQAQPITELGDFQFVEIDVRGARQVAGFGAARSLDAQDIAQALRPAG